jgi:hypothetical protein
MSDGPIANYIYNSGYPDAADKKLGYAAVGPGWAILLETLDSIMVSSIAHAIQHATVVKEEYRDKQCKTDASIKILQVKEKFGGLRVYWQGEGLGDRIWNQVGGAAHMTEALSYKTCEKCGSMEGAETRKKKDMKLGGRVLTLCESCHKERDNLGPADRFEFGNGDWTV